MHLGSGHGSKKQFAMPGNHYVCCTIQPIMDDNVSTINPNHDLARYASCLMLCRYTQHPSRGLAIPKPHCLNPPFDATTPFKKEFPAQGKLES